MSKYHIFSLFNEESNAKHLMNCILAKNEDILYLEKKIKEHKKGLKSMIKSFLQESVVQSESVKNILNIVLYPTLDNKRVRSRSLVNTLSHEIVSTLDTLKNKSSELHYIKCSSFMKEFDCKNLFQVKQIITEFNALMEEKETGIRISIRNNPTKEEFSEKTKLYIKLKV